MDARAAGRLFIQAHSANDGSGFPYLGACRITTLGCSDVELGQGTISIGVEGGRQYEITVTVPWRDVPRRYTISTSLPG